MNADVIYFLLTLVVVFLIDYFIILKNKLTRIKNPQKSKKSKKIEIIEVTYVSQRFKITKEKLYNNTFILCAAIINAFIISFVSTIITIIPLAFAFKLLIGFVLLFGLIYSLYEIYGRILTKKID